MAGHDDRWDPERQRRQPVDPGGDQILDRMVAHRGRHIDIGVGIMQRVQPPQKRYRVLAAMHRVLQQVEQQEPSDKPHRRIANRPGGEGQAKSRLELGSEDRRRGEDKRRQHDIQEPDADVAEAPAQRRELPLPPRPAEFPSARPLASCQGESRGSAAPPRAF